MSAAAIKRHIIRKGRGWVFTPSDFLNLGSRSTVDQALSRLAKDGTIRRLAQGVYDYPKVSARFGVLAPDPYTVAKVIADKDGHVIQVTPMQAANLLGLSTQVPAKPVYLTDGPSRTRQVGNTMIKFKRAAPKNLVGTGKRAGLIFQALRYVGQNGINDHVISRLANALSPSDAKSLYKDSLQAPSWMQPVALQIAQAV